MPPEDADKKLSRRQWLTASARWAGAGVLGAIAAVLAGQSSGRSSRTGSICEGCRYARANCRPGADCRLDPRDARGREGRR